MRDEAVYTALAVIGVCVTIALVSASVLLLGTIFASWMGLILGAVL